MTEPIADLIAEVQRARALEDAAYEKARPFAQHYGAARGELVAEMLRGVLTGDELGPWLELVGPVLNYPPLENGRVHGMACDSIGRDLAHWLQRRVNPS